MNSKNMTGLKPYSVSELNQYIASLLEQDLFLKHIQISGEIAGMKVYSSSGHGYFTLKDSTSSISCVIFSNWLKRLPFVPQDGMQVYLSGAVSVYQKQGRYQFYVEDIQPAGLGEYYLKLEYLKQKLQAEGIFDLERKRSIPARASRIGLVTSLYGAALKDMVRILRLRQPGVEIVIAHSLVQGEEAAASLKNAIEQMNRYGQVDLIIVGRGGGSVEDLKAFNEEEVVRAIYASKIPVIAAIGHEVDYSLSDLAADVRAATPTQAAQLAVPDDAELFRRICSYQQNLHSILKRQLRQAELNFDDCMEYLQEHVKGWVTDSKKQQVVKMVQRLQNAMQQYRLEAKRRTEKQAAQLAALNPLQTLKRGYAVVTRADEYLYRAASIQEKDQLWIHMYDGKVQVQVLKKELHEEN